MTSKFTREELLNIIETDHVQCGEASALARMALAAMNIEPVAVIDQANLDYLRSGADADVWPPEREEMGDVLLYRHAQQPVVPEDVRQALSQMDDEIIAELDAEESACRAATLQAGNSPAQSDCCPAQNHVSPEQNGDTPAQSQGWIPVSERMPEMGEHQCYVLAADFKNHYWPNIPNTQVGVYGDWFGDGNPTWDDGDGEDLHLKEVTHWMLLPAAPQEVMKGE
ncbi:DUF551 domain-containing protein [Klebsiella michiganensis]|uniref:DUF551 domain-containing protein n=1 Tax=Klebsiella michiganensis TaxID=1134687 RepID=UPI003CF3CB3F